MERFCPWGGTDLYYSLLEPSLVITQYFSQVTSVMFSGTRVTPCDEGSIITGARCRASLLRLGLLLGMGTGGG
jgi:hypothetical protein